MTETESLAKKPAVSAVDQFVALLGVTRETGVPPAASARAVSTLRRPLFMAVVAALMLMIAAASTVMVLWQSDRQQTVWRKAETIETSAIALKADLIDAETGQRGYLLTGNDAFLEPYTTALTVVPARIVDLRTAIGGRRTLQLHLDSIAALWSQKQRALQRAIDLARAGRAVEATAAAADESGRRLTDSLRALLDSVSSIAITEADRAELAAGRLRTWLFLIAGAALALAVLVGLWQIFRMRALVGLLSENRQQLESANIALRAAHDEDAHAIQATAALLGAMTESTADLLYAKDLDGRFVFVNEATLRLLGRPRADVIGRKASDFLGSVPHILDAERTDARVMKTGVSEQDETTFVRGGATTYLLATKTAIVAKSGAVIGVVGISADLTQRKRAEHNARLSERRFRAAIAAFDGVVWTASTPHGLTSASPAWTVLTGQSEADALGTGWSKMLHPDDVAPTARAWVQSLRTHQPFVGVYRVRSVTGTMQITAVRAVPVTDEDNRVVEWVGMNLDITTEREAQDGLRVTADRLDFALEAAETGAWDFDPAAGAFSLDPRAAGFLAPGGSASASLETVLALVHPGDRAAMAATFARAAEMQDGERIASDFRVVQNGEEVWLAIRSTVKSLPNGARSLIGTLHDVTRRKRQEERIAFLMRELAHRTKNSLAIVQAIARQTAIGANNLEEFGHSFQRRLQGMAQSLSLLVDHDWRGSPIRSLVSSQLEHFDTVAGSRIVLDGPDLFLEAEAAQNIGLSLHELTTNAIKYGALSNDKGMVRVTWRVEPDAEGRPRFRLAWRESGGPPVVPPQKKGFGHTVMQRVVRAALAGESDLRFDVEGVSWDLTIDVSHVLPQAD